MLFFNQHCRVSQCSRENPKLGNWVNKQRERKEALLPEQIKQLDDIGFVWEPHQESWKTMFEMLHDYKAEHGVSNFL